MLKKLLLLVVVFVLGMVLMVAPLLACNESQILTVANDVSPPSFVNTTPVNGHNFTPSVCDLTSYSIFDGRSLSTARQLSLSMSNSILSTNELANMGRQRLGESPSAMNGYSLTITTTILMTTPSNGNKSSPAALNQISNECEITMAKLVLMKSNQNQDPAEPRTSEVLAASHARNCISNAMFSFETNCSEVNLSGNNQSITGEIRKLAPFA